MSGIQKFFTTLFRGKAAEIEAESRQWILRGACGHEYSVWDAGGVRWKAKGYAHVYRRCLICGQASSHSITRKQA